MKILKFTASWCSPCKMLSKVFEDIDSTSIPEVQSIDTDQEYQLSQKYNVRGVPTLVLIDDEGKELKRMSGYQNKEKILEFCKY